MSPPHLATPPGCDVMIWQGLTSEHADLAIGNEHVLRYRADVGPFASLQPLTSLTLHQLSQYTLPGEKLGVALPVGHTLPDVGKEWRGTRFGSIVHMQLTSPLTADPTASAEVRQLTEADMPAILQLTALVLPKFFRDKTILMGHYFGIHRGGQLIAMAGERFVALPWREVSAVCTHPDYQRQGFAQLLTRYVCQKMHERGEKPMLSVGSRNTAARALYEKLGFEQTEVFDGWLIERLQTDQAAVVSDDMRG